MWLLRLIAHLIYATFGHHIVDAVPQTQQYQEPGQSILSTPEYASEILNDGGWQCCCGRANRPYVSTCVCGMNKNGTGSVAIQQHRQNQEQYEERLQEQIHKCHLLYASHFISQEEYEAELDRIRRFGPN